MQQTDHEDLRRFTRQIAWLLEAGIPTSEALSLLAPNETSRLSIIAGELAAASRAGLLLSEAMNGHPDTFSEDYRLTVAAGEYAGRLGEAFADMADELQRRAVTYAASVAATAFVVAA